MPLFEIANANAYMSANEKYLLGLAAASLPAGSTVVEVGAFLGGSAEIMLRAAGERIRLHSIDIKDMVPAELKTAHANFSLHEERASDFARREDMAIDLLFIDGDHSFSGIKEDAEAFWPRLKDGPMVPEDAHRLTGKSLFFRRRPSRAPELGSESRATRRSRVECM